MLTLALSGALANSVFLADPKSPSVRDKDIHEGLSPASQRTAMQGSSETGDVKPFRKPGRTVQTRKLLSRQVAARPPNGMQTDLLPQKQARE